MTERSKPDSKRDAATSWSDDPRYSRRLKKGLQRRQQRRVKRQMNEHPMAGDTA